VRVSWLIKSGRLSPLSPTALISEKLGIRWLPMFNGEYVYGPTPGLIEAADLLLAGLRPRVVIDLFGGSGALSKLAILRGARRVIYVDENPEAALLNLRRYRSRVEIVEGDAFTFLEGGVSCDVMIADPPEELIGRLLERLDAVRRIVRKAALIWLGPAERAASPPRGGRMMTRMDAWGDSFLLLWKPGFGRVMREVKERLG